jgi:hypothetical protein
MKILVHLGGLSALGVLVATVATIAGGGFGIPMPGLIFILVCCVLFVAAWVDLIVVDVRNRRRASP